MYGHVGAWRVPGYTEIRDLGTGAAGRVVLARHDDNGTLVAVKYLSADLRQDLAFVGRFRHEARLLALMEPNPHTARLYEYVEAPQGSAIVMELVDGVSLRAMLRSEGPTGAEAALAVLKGSLLGLASAHALGVVHRDYKPENVIVEANGVSKLVDFGIAAPAGEATNMTGTPPYMAPEQWAGANASPSTDVYAATVVFFECLTGARPFRAQNVAALARQHQGSPPPIEEVPPQLRSLIERGMAKHPQERPPSAEAFLRELEAVAAEAYGRAWEERGRRRLASLAGLLLPFFPLTEQAPEVESAIAETALGGAKIGPLGLKLVLAGVGLAVIAGGTAVVVGSMGGTTLSAGATVQSSSPAAPASVEDPTTEPADTPSEEPTDDAVTDEPTPASTQAVNPPATGAPRPTATASPSPTASKKPSPKPSKKASPKASETDEPGGTTTADPGPQPSPTRTTRRPTPTPTPTTSSPTPSDTPTSPSESPSSDPGSPSATSSEPVASAAMGFFAVGLMTTGLVPATLAMGRVVGRHRRRK